MLAVLTAFSAPSAPDPFVLRESFVPAVGLWMDNRGYTDTNAKTLRSAAINTGIKNLVLIVAGQSNMTALAPSAYTVTNSSAVDNFNIYDGGVYSYSDPPLGSSWVYLALGGSLPTPNPGSIGGRIADKFVTAGKFSRVIVVPVAIGATSVLTHDTGVLADRLPIAIRRLAAAGITPATTNVTFAIVWGQGESDGGTSTVNYTTRLNNVRDHAVAAGFSGRFFVNKQTWAAGSVDANVQAAQTGVVDNVKFWAGADADSLNAANRQSDNTHFNDTGIAALATAMYDAMVASGSPY